MAGRTAALGEGLVLEPALLPAPQLIVTAGAEIRALLYEETLVGATVWLVAVCTSTLGHRRVDNRPASLLLDVTMASGAERTGAFTQQGAVAGRVRVMTRSAVPALDRRVGVLGIEGVSQVVTAETNLFLVDLAPRLQLAKSYRGSTEKTTGHQAGRDQTPPRKSHWAPPWLSSRSS